LVDLNKLWGEKIARAKKIKEAWEQDFKTKMGWEYFEGKQNPGIPDEEWITVNRIYSHLKAQLPSLYSIDPYFYVKLKKSYVTPADATPEGVKKAADSVAKMERQGKIRQAMLNYLKGELGLKEKCRLSIQDAHFEFGVLKVAYAADMQPHEKAGEMIKGDNGDNLKGEDGKVLRYPDEVPVNERYELSRVHPCNILFDEDAGPLEESWSWVAERMVMSKADALADRRFKKAAVRSMGGKPRKEDGEEKKSGIISKIARKLTGEKEEEVLVEIYRIFDLRNKKTLCWGDGADDLVADIEDCPPGIERHPYEFLRFTMRGDSPYPIPVVFPALGPQKELGLSRSRRLVHRKRFNRKYEVNENLLAGDPKETVSKLENGADGTCISVNQSGAVVPIQDAPLDQQEILELQMLDRDIVEAFGTPGSARGIADSDSATEADILDTRLQIREGDASSVVADFVTGAARKLDQLVQAHIQKDEAVKITGPQGEFWQLVKKSDYSEIEGEYEYSVNMGFSKPRLPQVERAQMIAFMSQVIIPFPHILTSPAMMKRFGEMYDIEDEVMLEELRQIGLKIMSGQMPMPGGQGGGPSDNPVAAVMGAAQGMMGGNANGGGASGPMGQ